MSENVCNLDNNSYGYIPSLPGGVIFTVIFGSLTLFSLYFTFRRKLWFLSFALGGILETLGWGARVGAHIDVCNKNLFIMQICCLILAPAFFTATLYILLGILIQQVPKLSVLSARNYLVVFCSIDFLSLLLQAIGGGMAGSAEDPDILQQGTNVMVAGVFVQIAGMTAFTLLGILFVFKSYRRGIPPFDGRILAILVSATVLIFVRNIFRCVELLSGWRGRINTTEGYLFGLDAATMVVCLCTLCYLVILDLGDGDLLERRRITKPADADIETCSLEKMAREPDEAST